MSVNVCEARQQQQQLWLMILSQMSESQSILCERVGN